MLCIVGEWERLRYAHGSQVAAVDGPEVHTVEPHFHLAFQSPVGAVDQLEVDSSNFWRFSTASRGKPNTFSSEARLGVSALACVCQ